MDGRERNARRSRRSIGIGVLLAVALVGMGCRADTPLDSVARRMTAATSAAPFAMPDYAMTAHTGEAFNVRDDTAGRFVLLFFGYTYCPDICPLTMASARAAVSRLPEADRDRVLPLFVTVDPGRDSIARLRAWLGTMDPDAIGLRGSTAELDGLMTAMGFVLPPSTSRRSIEGATDEDYLVPHPASLFLITPDGLGRFQYGWGRATPEEIAGDLRMLMELEW